MAPPRTHGLAAGLRYLIFAALFVALEPLIAREVAEFIAHNFGRPTSLLDGRLLLVPLLTATSLLLAAYVPLRAFVFRVPPRGAAHVVQYLATGLIAALLAAALALALLAAGLVNAREHAFVEAFAMAAALYLPLAEAVFRPASPGCGDPWTRPPPIR